ncbi:roadblock/LC7 domain-containing protein [Kitasatospora atroaurantiaca]|uniref:Putative regulator of Ras-like GTPase activity (Roadblock/LC7/MglB family) n=1 Tax=Kitasatospora atroaurantiaca TaxID=285545 RepID=A0A561ETE0_9ACTN|nr:roadblock/LC7 domain-containing protein [Kitasatospora atroaurantiaca]TWE18884.1 putative regulator of Ras-like GTPase activity (Roadblock/LC7/MglB family) [Kitasatospora atroaurantiaca]
MTPNPDLGWLLADIVTVPEVQHAVVVSNDGLEIGRSERIAREDAERLAAACSGLQSLARGVAQGFGGRHSSTRQIIIEYGGGYLFIVAAGAGAHLAVVTGEAVDAGLVAYQMQVLVERIGAHLTSPPRVEQVAGELR